MTSLIAVIGITFDGVDVQDIDGLFLEIVGGLSDSPTVRGIDVTIPGAAGQVARPRKFHERRPLLQGWIRGFGPNQDERQAVYRQGITAMLELFDATAVPAPLVLMLEDGSTASVDARTLQVATVELVKGEYANVSIEMLAVEDWVYEALGS